MTANDNQSARAITASFMVSHWQQIDCQITPLTLFVDLTWQQLHINGSTAKPRFSRMELNSRLRIKRGAAIRSITSAYSTRLGV